MSHCRKYSATPPPPDLVSVVAEPGWYDAGEVKPQALSPNPRCRECRDGSMWHLAHPWAVHRDVARRRSLSLPRAPGHLIAASKRVARHNRASGVPIEAMT